mmetsp:Transcript_15234/g.37159  ORF Transcript_15234/g.37159 Transcript_15234/m.37159 type:complete len:746 (+) Transcript_15234:95-2332(+)
MLGKVKGMLGGKPGAASGARPGGRRDTKHLKGNKERGRVWGDTTRGQDLKDATDVKASAKPAADAAVIKKAIEKTNVGARMSPEHMNDLIDHMDVLHVDKGKSRPLPPGLIVVTAGQVVLSSDDAKGTAKSLATGQHYGEEMLLYDDSHMYTLKSTKSDSTVYVLTKRTFHLVFKWAQKREYGANEKLIRTMPIFHHTTPTERLKLASALTVEKFTDGQVILKAGDKIGHLYIMRLGEASIRKGDVEVSHKYPGDYFGEESLFGASVTEHAVVAQGENVEIAYITRQDFVLTVGEPKEVLNRDLSALNKLAIGSIPLLAVLDADVREKLASNLTEESFKKGDTVFRMGDPGNKLYIIKEGEVDVMVGSKQIDHLYQGNFFGERALMDDKPRMATVLAHTALVVYSLSKSFFVTTIKPLKEPQQLIRRRRSSEDTRDASSLSTIAQVGKGAYGLVFLVEHDQTKDKYALKAQKKIQSRRDNMFQERNLMADMMPHPNVCCMFNTYQDSDWVYMLIEYLPGGDLFDVQDDIGGTFNEEQARFYIAGVVLALEHMHKQHVIYRDLKPENVLVDSNGYIKVVDLGLAKRLAVGTKTFTQCGTPCYFSPEIIQHLAYDFAVDWWCSGVLLFELLTGRTPFETADHNVQAMYVKILKNDIVFPEAFSTQVQSLIAALLHPKAAKRLGNLQNDADDVKMHPFFLGFDWDALYDKRLEAPFKPKSSVPSSRSAGKKNPIKPYTPSDEGYWEGW